MKDIVLRISILMPARSLLPISSHAQKRKAASQEMAQFPSEPYYDDVENFPNKFTANYLFLIGQTNSTIPRVNKPNRERRQELEAQWQGLKARGSAPGSQKIPEYNRKLWEAGIGALQITK